MSDKWTDKIAGARMRVDQQFNPRVQSSEFSSQEWGLIMTAVEFDIHEPDDPDRAKLYADTDKLPEILPELDRIEEQMGGAPASAQGGSSSGIAGTLKRLVGNLGSNGTGGNDQQRLNSAESLVQDYANELQEYLESQGRWDEIRAAATADPEAER